MRHSFITQKQQSALLVIDIQAGLEKVISEFNAVVANTITLLNAADTLQVPVLFTEQNPTKLGATASLLTEKRQTPLLCEKMHFSACLANDFLPQVAQLQRPQLVIVGMETHVCVLQTCLDLLAEGYQLFIVADAVASRNTAHKAIALSQLQQAGAVITCAESVVFQWLEQAGNDEFRSLLKTIK
ncbi:isochorismatase family protein [Pseudoalteromonas mariniglutinosa]|uniref:isochorismatase family protein n=1 Tax=Pseudoalteromonas mariniglutinosa TaxID=206042 RepID=UPI00384E9D19